MKTFDYNKTFNFDEHGMSEYEIKFYRLREFDNAMKEEGYTIYWDYNFSICAVFHNGYRRFVAVKMRTGTFAKLKEYLISEFTRYVNDTPHEKIIEQYGGRF